MFVSVTWKMYLFRTPCRWCKRKFAWLSGLQTRLVSMRTWVRSLASLSELRIQCCHELWCRSQMRLRSGVVVAVAVAGSYSSHSTPSLGTSICCGCGSKRPENKNKNKKRKKKENDGVRFVYIRVLDVVLSTFLEVIQRFSFFKKLSDYSWFTMLYLFQVCSKVSQSYIYTYPLYFPV